MSKYDPLGKFLERNNSNTIEMTFDEIEEVLTTDYFLSA